MKKQVFAVFFSILVGMSNVFAWDISSVCPTGQKLYYKIIDADNLLVELTYPGSGNNGHYWTNDTEPVGEIELPITIEQNNKIYTLTSIGDYAFYDCYRIRGNMVIPNSVTSIGKYAFYNCWFDSVSFGNNLISIGECAFSSCRNLIGDLVIPNSVTTIGEWAFSGCIKLSGELVIGESVTTIGRHAFECRGFNEIHYNAKNCSIMGTSTESVFTNCPDLTTLYFGENVESIPDYAFKNCTYFYGSDLNLPNSVKSIGNSSFFGCTCYTGNLVLGNSLISIGEQAFEGCIRLKGNLNIPNSVQFIGNRAFYNCNGFSGDLIIPNSVTTIGNSAFAKCNFDGTLELSNSLHKIGESAFYGCSRFKGDLVIGCSVDSICDYAFYNFGGSGNLILPESLKYIGDYAFSKCNYNCQLVIPDSVRYIGTSAFAECYFNGELVIGKSVTKIGGGAFYNCSYLTSISYKPINIMDCSHYIFTGCSNVNTLTVMDNVESLPDNIFCGLNRLNQVIVKTQLPPVVNSSGFSCFTPALPIWVQCGTESLYREAYGWNQFDYYHELLNYDFHVSSNNEEMGFVNVIQQPDCENDAIVEAEANEGYYFMGWMIDEQIVSTDKQYSFTLMSDIELVAVFGGMGVDDNEISKIDFFPNPAITNVTIKSEGLTRIDLFDMFGQCLNSYFVNGEKTIIEISQLSSGVYLLDFFNENGKHFMKKLVKK